MALLVDTGVLFALAYRKDAWHLRVRSYLESHPQTLLAPVTVLPEAAYLFRERIGVRAERAFIASLANGEIAVEPLSPVDVRRAARIMDSYEQLGFVDATVVAIAERLKLREIATTDRRDFGVVRPSHADRFQLVP